MATETSPAEVAQTDISALHDKLDNLWAKHLTLLDQYQRAQEQLAKHMSSVSLPSAYTARQGRRITAHNQAFLSLAQANFNSPTRIRYGQDYYDERMRATRRVTINQTTDTTTLSITHTPHTPNETQIDSKPKLEDTTLPSPPSTPREHSANDKEEKETSYPEATDKSNQLKDPLTWFGILVPPALRAAQTSFSSAISEPAAEAVEAARGMREIETEIRRVRKAVRRAMRGLA